MLFLMSALSFSTPPALILPLNADVMCQPRSLLLSWATNSMRLRPDKKSSFSKQTNSPHCRIFPKSIWKLYIIFFFGWISFICIVVTSMRCCIWGLSLVAGSAPSQEVLERSPPPRGWVPAILQRARGDRSPSNGFILIISTGKGTCAGAVASWVHLREMAPVEDAEPGGGLFPYNGTNF